MPEGVEVRIMSEQLHRLLVGKKTIIHGNERRVESVLSKGKKLIILMDEGCLVYSFGLNGYLRVGNPTNNTKSYMIFEDLILCHEAKGGIYGNVSFIESIDKLKNVGKDIFEIDTFEDYISVINKVSNFDVYVCEFLIDQKYVSGIGNYLRSEILYHSYINPFRRLSSFSIGELRSLYTSSKYICDESYKKGGFYSCPGYNPKVYKKNMDDFGNYVSCKEVSGRKVYFVEKIQI